MKLSFDEMKGTKTMDTKTLQERIAAIPYWYHTIELPGGIVTPGWSPLCADRYSIPDDMTGLRVLDIGAWDGYWTWEALKRGAAEVVAIDDFSDRLGSDVDRSGKWATFDLCREAFGFDAQGDPTKDIGVYDNAERQGVRRAEMSVYDISEETIGRFDVVFCFGTLYHLKHPLLALEKIAAVCDGSIYIESAVADDYSPYRGGLANGYAQNEHVMEFYPRNEYGGNAGNWWVPTLQCMGDMLATVGFADIQTWPLTEPPQELSQCRGFLSASKDPAKAPASRPADVAAQVKMAPVKVAAVMSVPRLGFQDNASSIFESMMGLNIPLTSVQGAFWGQCLERGIQQVIDEGADLIVAIDYDTVFTKEDLQAMLQLMLEHPEATALVPIHMGRQKHQALLTVKGRSGAVIENVPLKEFSGPTTKIATGHFGLTILRASELLKVPHPWFLGQPNTDGMWGPGRIDDDIYFWKHIEKHGKTVLSANRVVLGHLELLITWPDKVGRAIHQVPADFHKQGKPETVWK